MSKDYICAIGLSGQSVFLNVDHFHVPGETIHADSIYTEPGGKAYNQAVAAARLGAPAMFIGAIGDDADGKLCRDFLDKERVSHCFKISRTSATAYACILTDSDGENRVTVYLGASSELSADYIRSCREEIAKCRILLLGLECPLDATVAALDLAEELGILTILNPAPAKALDISLLRRFHVITPNEQETRVLTGINTADEKELCLALHDKGIQRAVVTLGENGALLYTGDKALKYPAVPCKAVNTTGAGDCFNAALAARILSGQGLEEAVVYAINASALCVQRPYVMSALPTDDEVRAAYASVTPSEILL